MSSMKLSKPRTPEPIVIHRGDRWDASCGSCTAVVAGMPTETAATSWAGRHVCSVPKAGVGVKP